MKNNIVLPLCTNIGFVTAIIAIIGRVYARLASSLCGPMSIPQKAIPETKQTVTTAGFIVSIAARITAIK